MFFYANEASIHRASLAQQQGIVIAGGQIFQFRNSKNFLIKGNQVCFKDWDDFWGGQKKSFSSFHVQRPSSEDLH